MTAPKNRLRLNFSLQTQEERSNFINTYIEAPEFQTCPLTESELTTIADYILWGVDSATQKNGHQSSLYGLKSNENQWDPNETESLEALLEQPLFNESQVREVGSIAPLKHKKEVFDRQKELSRAGAYSPLLLDLFQRIDEVDYQVEKYELNHNRRTKEIRPELLQHLSEWGSDLEKLEEATTHWGLRGYLLKKHQLVDMRREQYTIRDSYAPIRVLEDKEIGDFQVEDADFGAGIEVLPLGLKQETASFLFKDFGELGPDLSEAEQRKASDIYWNGKNFRPGANQFFVDFRNGYHLQKIVEMFGELNQSENRDKVDQNLGKLLETFEYYWRQADLDEPLNEILKMKIKGYKNGEIMEEINQKYGKSYTVNYISTLYCQKIIGRISEAANRHQLLIENIWYPENWKKCIDCGRVFLRDNISFTKKNRAADGFSSRCKKCEKKIRDSKKVGS